MSDPHPLVCRFGALGDMVLLTPMLRLLYARSGLPCDIVGIGGFNRALFAEMPWVRNVYTIDSRSKPYLINRSQRDLVKALRARQHRFAWVCETNRKSYRLLARAGISRGDCANQLDLSPVPGEHYCEKWLRLGNLSPNGFDAAPIEQSPAGTELFVSPAEIDECRAWLAARAIDAQAPLLCIQAGSKRTMRRGRVDRASNSKYWHERNWAAVIDAVIEQLPGAQVMLCGVPAESDMCSAIEANCAHSGQVHNVADDLPIRRLLALLSLAHSCISVDTGPAHAAAALNCPLVVLFGKADPDRFRPRSLDSPIEMLLGHGSDGEADIANIGVQQVISAWQAAGGL